MNGVEEEPGGVLDYTTGDFGLNNGVYTTMSYNDGWDKDGPNGSAPTNDWGYQGTLMAFDVAVLQQKYGANMDYKTGNNTYVLPEANAAGTFYSCIWDAGGEDRIVAANNLDSVINLNAATLEYEEGGGGWVSWSDGIFGGFTIANGVTIENAQGGKGDDTITGNLAANELDGGKGADTIDGGAGADVIIGGIKADTLTGGGDDDTFVFDEGHSLRNRRDTIDDLSATDIVDLSAIDADSSTGGDDAFTLVDHLSGVAGQLLVKFDSGTGNTRFVLDWDGDGRANMKIDVTGDLGAYDNFIL
jgi:serralysin